MKTDRAIRALARELANETSAVCDEIGSTYAITIPSTLGQIDILFTLEDGDTEKAEIVRAYISGEICTETWDLEALRDLLTVALREEADFLIG